MKIIVMRHAPVQMQWKKKYSSAGFDSAMKEYDQSSITETADVEVFPDDGRPLYVSMSKRTQDTARLLFGDRAVISTPLLDEVPLLSFKDTRNEHPLWLWNVAGRLQWFFGQSRQPESRSQTKERARDLVRALIREGDDCILISHGWFMRTLIGEFDSAGFVAKRSSLFGVKPLERIVLTEKALHCGNCAHNCPLTHPGCDIGKEKAITKGLASR